MSLQKDYEVPSTGATASYHFVQQVGLDRISNLTNATVASYLSSDAHSAGKFPLYTQQIALSGLPPKGVDAFDFAEQGLVESPADGAAFSVGTRYAFAGAEIVA